MTWPEAFVEAVDIIAPTVAILGFLAFLAVPLILDYHKGKDR